MTSAWRCSRSLNAALGQPGVDCIGEGCIYWRLVEHLGLVEGVDEDGCAVQHFELLEGGAPVAEWLLSVKQRLEAQGLTLSPSPSEDGPAHADS